MSEEDYTAGRTESQREQPWEEKWKIQYTKRGRARLRALLFRAVMPMVAKNAEFKALHQYFTISIRAKTPRDMGG